MHKADNLPLSCAVVMKSGNLNFLEPSGPLQACNGTALPFFTYIAMMYGRTNRFYNERGSRTSYVRSSTPHYVGLLCVVLKVVSYVTSKHFLYS